MKRNKNDHQLLFHTDDSDNNSDNNNDNKNKNNINSPQKKRRFLKLADYDDEDTNFISPVAETSSADVDININKKIVESLKDIASDTNMLKNSIENKEQNQRQQLNQQENDDDNDTSGQKKNIYNSKKASAAETSFLQKYNLKIFNKEIDFNKYYPLYSHYNKTYYAWPKNVPLTSDILSKSFENTGHSLCIAEELVFVRCLSFDINCICRYSNEHEKKSQIQQLNEHEEETQIKHLKYFNINDVEKRLKEILKPVFKFRSEKQSIVPQQLFKYLPNFLYQSNKKLEKYYDFQIYGNGCNFHFYTNIPVSRMMHHKICAELNQSFSKGKIEVPSTFPLPFSAKNDNAIYQLINKTEDISCFPVCDDNFEPFLCMYTYFQEDEKGRLKKEPRKKTRLIAIGNSETPGKNRIIIFKTQKMEYFFYSDAFIYPQYQSLEVSATLNQTLFIEQLQAENQITESVEKINFYLDRIPPQRVENRNRTTFSNRLMNISNSAAINNTKTSSTTRSIPTMIDVNDYIDNNNPTPPSTFLNSIFFKNSTSKSIKYLSENYDLNDKKYEFYRRRIDFLKLCRSKKIHKFLKMFVYYHHTQTITRYNNDRTKKDLGKNKEIINSDFSIVNINKSKKCWSILASPSSSQSSNLDTNNCIDNDEKFQEIINNEAYDEMILKSFKKGAMKFEKLLQFIEYFIKTITMYNGMHIEIYLIILKKYLENIEMTEFKMIIETLFYFVINFDIESTVCKCKQVLKKICETFDDRIYIHYTDVPGENMLQYMALRHVDKITPYMKMKDIVHFYVEKYLNLSEYYHAESVLSIINSIGDSNANNSNCAYNSTDTLTKEMQVYTKQLIAIFIEVCDKYEFILHDSKTHFYYLYNEFGSYKRFISFKLMNLSSFLFSFIRNYKTNIDDLLQLFFSQNINLFNVNNNIYTPNIILLYSTYFGKFNLINSLYSLNDKYLKMNRHIFKGNHVDDNISPFILNSRLLVETLLDEQVVTLYFDGIVPFHNHFKVLPGLMALRCEYPIEMKYVEKMYDVLHSHLCFNYTELYILPDIYPIDKYIFIKMYYIAVVHKFDVFITYNKLCKEVLNRHPHLCTESEWLKYFRKIEANLVVDKNYEIGVCSKNKPVHFDILLSMNCIVEKKIYKPSPCEVIRIISVLLVMAKCFQYRNFMSAIGFTELPESRLLSTGKHKYNVIADEFKDEIIEKKRSMYKDVYYFKQSMTSKERKEFNQIPVTIKTDSNQLERDLYIVTSGLITRNDLTTDKELIRIILISKHRDFFLKYIEYKKLLNELSHNNNQYNGNNADHDHHHEKNEHGEKEEEIDSDDSDTDIFENNGKINLRQSLLKCKQLLMIHEPFSNYDQYYNTQYSNYYMNDRLVNQQNLNVATMRVFGERVPKTCTKKINQLISLSISCDFDFEKLVTFLEILAYLFIGRNIDRYAFILNGDSGGGKTFIFDKLEKVFTPFCTRLNNADFKEINSRTNSQGESFLIIINEISRINSSDLKSITGNDSKMTKVFHTQHLDNSPYVAHFIGANNGIIKIDGIVDDVTYKRIKIVPVEGLSALIYNDHTVEGEENLRCFNESNMTFLEALLNKTTDKNTLEDTDLALNALIAIIMEFLKKNCNYNGTMTLKESRKTEKYRHDLKTANNQIYKNLTYCNFEEYRPFNIQLSKVINTIKKNLKKEEYIRTLEGLPSIFKTDNVNQIVQGMQNKLYISQMENTLASKTKIRNKMTDKEVQEFIFSHYGNDMDIDNAIRYFWYTNHKFYNRLSKCFENLTFVNGKGNNKNCYTYKALSDNCTNIPKVKAGGFINDNDDNDHDRNSDTDNNSGHDSDNEKQSLSSSFENLSISSSSDDDYHLDIDDTNL